MKRDERASMATTSLSNSGRRAAGHHPSASIKQLNNNFLFLLHTAIIILLTTTPLTIHAQQYGYYVTYTAGELCNKKPTSDFESWEQSFDTLEQCCDAKVGYDYDNCCNPTADGLISCLQESCAKREGCSNGLYDEETCKCLCVPSFTLDEEGDCTVPVDTSTTWIENPFASCEIDVDCPWWMDPMRLEKCETGAEIPMDVTVVDWTREECCERHFPGSKFCNKVDGSSGAGAATSGGGGGAGGGVSGTEIVVDLSKFEVIPVKFSIINMPPDVDVPTLQEQVRITLKDFMLDLAERFTGTVELGVSSVTDTTFIRGGGMNELGGMDVYYDVKVIREPEQEFGPTITDELLRSYEDIEKDIQVNTFTDATINICFVDDSDGELVINDITMPLGSSFSNCAFQLEEVTIDFRFKGIPKKIVNDTIHFDSVKMEIMEAYKQILTDGDASFEGMTLLSVVNRAEVSLPDGGIEVQFNIVVKAEIENATYAAVIEEKIASSRDVIVNQLQLYTDEDTDWNVDWCMKGEGILTVCTPGEKVLGEVKAFPVWGIVLIVLGIIGLIVLICICCGVKCKGFAYCCARSKNSRKRSKKADAFNRVNMQSYIVSGRTAQKGPSTRTRRKKSSFGRVDHVRRVKNHRSHSSGARHDNRRRSGKERRHSSRSRSRYSGEEFSSRSRRHDRRQSQRRDTSRKKSHKIDDSDDFSVPSFDPEIQEDQMVVYGGEQNQQMVSSSDEEEEQVNRATIMSTQSRRPDPDGFVVMDNQAQALDNDEIVHGDNDGEGIVAFRV